MAEMRTQTYIGMDISYINKKIGNEWIKESKAISAMLVGLIRSLEDKSRQ